MWRVWRRTSRADGPPDPERGCYGYAHVGDFDSELEARERARSDPFEGWVEEFDVSLEPADLDAAAAERDPTLAQNRYAELPVGSPERIGSPGEAS